MSDEIEKLRAELAFAHATRNQFDQWSRESRALLRVVEAERDATAKRLAAAERVIEAARRGYVCTAAPNEECWCGDLEQAIAAYDALAKDDVATSFETGGGT